MSYQSATQSSTGWVTAFSALASIPQAASLSSLSSVFANKEYAPIASAAVASTGLLLALRAHKLILLDKKVPRKSDGLTQKAKSTSNAEKLNASEASIRVACALGDTQFVYALSGATNIEKDVKDHLSTKPQNFRGDVSSLQLMETRAGAGSVVVGAAASGAAVVVHASAEALLAQLPSLIALASHKLPVVFHASAQMISNALEIHPSTSAIMAARSAGSIMVASRTAQESYDMSIVAHIVAKATKTPVVHFFDGSTASRDVDVVSKLNDSKLLELWSEVPESDVLKAFDRIAGKLDGDYRAFEYTGAPNASVVIVALGGLANAFKNRVRYLVDMRNESVGVVNVRLLQPWSAQRLVEAIPATASTVCVVDYADAPSSACTGPLFQSVSVSLASSAAKIIPSLVKSADGDLSGVLCDRIVRNAQREDPRSDVFLESTAYAPALLRRAPSVQPSVAVPAESKSLVSKHQFAWQMMFPERYASKQALHPHSKHPVYLAKVIRNKRLTPLDYHRNVFHIELDISGTGLKYEIGDALGVYGQNRHEDVSRFLDAYDLDGNAFVDIADADDAREVMTVRQLFTRHLDIFGKPPKKFYMQLAEYATDDYEHHKLRWIGSADYQEGYKLRELEALTYADLILEFASAKLTVADFLAIVPPIKPRHYSIASSMKANPGAVHLLVVVVEWKTPSGKKKYGQCSKYLSDLVPTPESSDMYVAVDIMPSILRLPEDPKTPIVMAGLGTGMAPFRAFIQERAYLKRQGVEVGPMTLYFGARYRAQEYLYGDELDEYEKQGLVNLRLAFSRDQEHKVYIQHKIQEDKSAMTATMLQNGGHFYLCGPTWPVPDIAEALISGFEAAGEGMSRTAAEEALENLKENKKYVLEVY